TLALQLEHFAVLCSRRNFQLLLTFEGRNFRPRTECRLRETDGELADDVVVVPAENRVRLDGDVAVQVAGRRALLTGLALAGDAHGLAFVHAGGDAHRHDALLELPSGPATAGAVLADDGSASAAVRAGRHHAE